MVVVLGMLCGIVTEMSLEEGLGALIFNKKNKNTQNKTEWLSELTWLISDKLVRLYVVS